LTGKMEEVAAQRGERERLPGRNGPNRFTSKGFRTRRGSQSEKRKYKPVTGTGGKGPSGPKRRRGRFVGYLEDGGAAEEA